MEFKFPVDSYDLKARYAPGLLLALPVLITLWTSFNVEIKEISGLVGGLLSAVLVYALSAMVRGMGRKLEPKLKENWGGFPSTLIVSPDDQTLGPELKRQYVEMAGGFLELPVPSAEDQVSDPRKSAVMIDQLFSKVKGVLRKNDKNGLWFTADCEYGFARNLYGSRWVWLLLSLASGIGSGISLYLRFSRLVLMGLALNVVLLCGCIILGWIILPGLTREIGFRYAEHAWESFYTIAQERKKRKEGPKHGKY